MSVEASIDIKLNDYIDYRIMDIIEALIKGGWTLKNDQNEVSYLPIGDEDNFDWLEKSITHDELRTIIEEKENSNELVGIKMYWKDTNIGITLLLVSYKEFSISLSINRKRINVEDARAVTDINWYVQTIIETLKQQKYQIERFTFEECQ